MEKDIVGHVSRCLNCQQVKYDHQKLGGFTQRLVISEWKWEHITIDFVVGLPWTLGKLMLFGSLWTDCKSAYFILLMTSYTSEKLAQVQLSTAFYPQTDGQSEQTVQILEDMLEPALLILEAIGSIFTIEKFDPGEARMLGTDFFCDALEKVKLIQDYLQTTHSRNKIYAYKKIYNVAFMEGEEEVYHHSKDSSNNCPMSFPVFGTYGHPLYLLLPESCSSKEPSGNGDFVNGTVY
ncbi:uncharacterized protein [Nicotiana tomentosiformis]|uniref:uncharacterized protein n=1 Tax=Nicotiana tomentosiformis TaxID=4098 RepID=UPI00388C8C7E